MHEIEDMFSVQKTPWHRLGKVVSLAPTSAEAIKLAGLDWRVDTEELQTLHGEPVPGARAAVRSTDRRVLGVVGTEWTPLQNSEAFGWFDAFVEAGEATYETAGSLREGSRVWILAKLNRKPTEVVKGDAVEKFVLLSNGHDGHLSARVGYTPIRVVCANTLRLAHNDKTSKLVRITHSKNIVDNLDAVRTTMNMADATFEATAEGYRALAKRKINGADLKKYVDEIFYPGRAPAAPAPDGDAKAPKSRIFESVSKLFEDGRGTEIKGVKGTMWGAYNAVNEYLGYERGEDEATRLNNMWYGDASKLNQRALDVAYQTVGVLA